MCGIFGYIGKRNSVEVALEGLKRLEYRGYDSAGLAGIHEGDLAWVKTVGNIASLEQEVKSQQFTVEPIIAHTRWATHGAPTATNAHPHYDHDKTITLVHNGIIDNHHALREQLKKEGIAFETDTDTEVIVHLIAKHYNGNILEAVQAAIPHLQGAYAIALIHRDHPDQILAVAHESPLVIGVGGNEAFIASDSHAFSAHTREVMFLSNAEIAIVSKNKLEVYDLALEQLEKESTQLDPSVADVTKGDYPHFTLKEIYEQPQTLRNAFASRLLMDYGNATFEEGHFNPDMFSTVKRVLILGCGTSWHAGCIASYMIEELAHIPVQVEIASEFRYKNPIVPSDTLIIAISQSGETADTLAAVREVKAKGAHLLAICNVPHSTLGREADFTLQLHAGPEIGVCSTKAFTSQVTVLSLIALMMARMRDLSRHQGQQFLKALTALPEQLQYVLSQGAHIESIAKKYAHYQNFFFLGRSYMYPSAQEGALKLKEIAYINANGYPAGEMKHGPIALISEECPTVAVCANRQTYGKMLNNIMEVKARKGPTIGIGFQSSEDLEQIADDTIFIPETLDALAPIPVAVVMQLFAYYVAKERGAEIDQPRNLAKSVTVE